MWWSRVLRVGWLIGLLGCQGEPDFALELHHPEGWIGQRPAVELPCRPALTGEVVINEVMVRPTGLDLDQDGAVNSGDEYIEVISRHGAGASRRGHPLVGGDNRGELRHRVCRPEAERGGGLKDRRALGSSRGERLSPQRTPDVR